MFRLVSPLSQWHRTVRCDAGLGLLLTAVFLCGCPAQESSSDNTVPVSSVGASDETAETGGQAAGQTSTGKTNTATGQEADAPTPGAHAEKRGQTNRLAQETSPYLLMHAHNPVDWYPWGPEALEKAKREGKLIFLSVGYSSCHWCHVMERETFSDPEIAEYLNKFFVCIKVDREERPDVDNIYMTSLYIFNQMSGIAGGGGWPLSMFLTPDAKPFFGGTYLPPRDGDRGVQSGFFTLVQRIQTVWTEQPATLRSDAEKVAEVTKLQLAGDRPNPLYRLSKTPFDDGLESLATQFDPEHGGFGFHPTDNNRPKFPEPSNLMLLVEKLRVDPDDVDVKKMLTLTLDRLYLGGIYDQLGGGFHRYSVDRFWHIPHFEKMLYDNAQLITVYANAYQLTGDPAYRRIVNETIEFLTREMREESGAFWSALDADSEGEEGKFYRWSEAELRQQIKGDDDWAAAAATWDIGGEPNFEGDYYVLLMSRSLAETASQQGVELEEWRTKLAPLKTRLLEARAERARPLTDTKILTAWNGLAIRGLADAGRLLDEPKYVEMAAQAANYLLTELRDDGGRLYRTQGKEEPVLLAYVDDYANLVDGLIALHQATGDERWLETAAELTEMQLELFWDEVSGGFYYTAEDHESLLARAKNPVDNVIPAGNSVTATNLIYLGQQLDRAEWLDRSEATIRSVTSLLQQAPSSVPRVLVAIQRYLEVRPDRAGKALESVEPMDEPQQVNDSSPSDPAANSEASDKQPSD